MGRCCWTLSGRAWNSPRPCPGLFPCLQPPMRGKPGSPVSRGPGGSQAQLLQSLFPEPLEQSLLPGYQKQLLAAQAQLQSGTAQLQAELLQSHTRLAELEVQVRDTGRLCGGESRGKGLRLFWRGRGLQAQSGMEQRPRRTPPPAACWLTLSPRCGSWSWNGPSTSCCWRAYSSGTRQTWSSLRMRTGTYQLLPVICRPRLTQAGVLPSSACLSSLSPETM